MEISIQINQITKHYYNSLFHLAIHQNKWDQFTSLKNEYSSLLQNMCKIANPTFNYHQTHANIIKKCFVSKVPLVCLLVPMDQLLLQSAGFSISFGPNDQQSSVNFDSCYRYNSVERTP